MDILWAEDDCTYWRQACKTWECTHETCKFDWPATVQNVSFKVSLWFCKSYRRLMFRAADRNAIRCKRYAQCFETPRLSLEVSTYSISVKFCQSTRPLPTTYVPRRTWLSKTILGFWSFAKGVRDLPSDNDNVSFVAMEAVYRRYNARWSWLRI